MLGCLERALCLKIDPMLGREARLGSNVAMTLTASIHGTSTRHIGDLNSRRGCLSRIRSHRRDPWCNNQAQTFKPHHHKAMDNQARSILKGHPRWYQLKCFPSTPCLRYEFSQLFLLYQAGTNNILAVRSSSSCRSQLSTKRKPDVLVWQPGSSSASP